MMEPLCESISGIPDEGTENVVYDDEPTLFAWMVKFKTHPSMSNIQIDIMSSAMILILISYIISCDIL